MTERPDAPRLLAEARRTLVEELLPGLAEAQRFPALMIASALGIAARELEAGDAAWEDLRAALGALSGHPEADLAALAPDVARAIREGRWDAEDRLYEALLAHVRARLAVANPKALPED